MTKQDDPRIYCLKFKALKTGYTWYGTGNYSLAEAEGLKSRFNAQMADTEVTVATIAEREKEEGV